MLRRALLVLAGLLVLGALVVGSAFGALSYPFDGQLVPAGGSFGGLEAGSVAVDDANGDTYVADSASGSVSVFETASGTQLAGLDGSLAPAGSFGGAQVEVAANNGTGDVYVLDSTDNVVDVFAASGGYVCQITGSASPSASECNGVAGSDTPAHGFSTPGGIAVDQATGDVYVVDAHHGVVDVFSATGAYLRQLSLASIPGGFGSLSETYTRAVAVDDFNGDVYVADSNIDVVYVFNAAGEYEATWTGANTAVGSFGGGTGYVSVAADDASGNVYVTDSADFVTDVFAPSGESIGQLDHFSNSSPVAARGTAVDQASGRIYVSEETLVDIFGPGVVVPDVRTGGASNVQPTSATLQGTVNPAGVQLGSCRFEYGTSTAYGQSVPCVPAAGSIPADSSDHAVSADVAGLQPGTVYHFRLAAANENDASEPNSGADTTFETLPPPSIASAAALNVTGASADLTARIDSGGLTGAYRFEYGISSAYGARVPVPDGDIAAGAGAQTVTQHVSGLQANTTYHWRVVAQNAAGITTGVDHTFIYDTSGAGLPDNRAYEMVTPPSRNGALVGVGFLIIGSDVAESGSRLTIASIQCFAGSSSCNANRQTEGDPFAFTRTPGGWVTSALAPAAGQYDSNTPWLFNADAGTALFSVPTPPAGEDDWLARRADGSFIDRGPVTKPSAGALGTHATGEKEATADFSHVIYELNGEGLWPFDATQAGDSSLYEAGGGSGAAPALVGVSGGAGSTDLISTCGAAFGGGEGDSPFYNSLSADGRTVFFTAAACPSGSGSNAGVEVPANTLYARIDGSRTVLISGRSPLDCTGACLGSTPSAAEYRGASTDGSKVFFTSRQRLTDAAGEGEQNLYEYDFARPVGENLVAISAGDTSGGGPGVLGVQAISSDGSHVYFVASGVLTGASNSHGQDAQAGAENLYVFERDKDHPGGHVAFIAVLPPSDEEFLLRGVSWLGFAGGGSLANVTPDGRFLVFISHGRLTPDDTSSNGLTQVFRYDAQTGELVRISVGERGFNDDGNAGLGGASIAPAHVAAHAGPVRPDPTMSHDGAYVFFESPVGLTPQALNNVQIGVEPIFHDPTYAENVYEWHEGHVYLISDGKDTSALSLGKDPFGISGGFSSVRLIGSDATGANVFFTTADGLTGQDTDGQMDYYDARVCTTNDPCVDGSTASVPSCAGEGCRGAPGAAPSLAAPVSASFSGAGNLMRETTPVVKAKKKVKPRKAKKHKKRRRKAIGKRGKAKRSVRSTRRGK